MRNPAKRPTRTICVACGAIGHTVGRCTDPAAVDYWRARALKFRALADEHAALGRSAAARGLDDDARYHHRATLLALEDAQRAERKAIAPGGLLSALPKRRASR